MDAGEQGAVRAAREVLLQLGETDEDEGQERFRVPLVVQEDVEMRHHVGVQQVSLVEEEDGVHLVAPEFLHVGLDGEEQVGRRGRRVQAERVAEVAVEVAAPEGGVAAVGEPKAGLGEVTAKGAQDARLADAGLAEQEHALPLGEGLLDVGDECGLALGEPEVGVVDLLREGRGAEAEGAEVRRGRHRRPPRRACARG